MQCAAVHFRPTPIPPYYLQSNSTFHLPTLPSSFLFLFNCFHLSSSSSSSPLPSLSLSLLSSPFYTLYCFTGDEAQVFEECFNSDGTLRLHLSRPIDGWISKLYGLVTKVTDSKGQRAWKEGDKVEGEAGEGDGDGERGRESAWSVLEKLDDDLEQWGESEGYRKEDRFFGTLQGSGYQVSVTPIILLTCPYAYCISSTVIAREEQSY